VRSRGADLAQEDALHVWVGYPELFSRQREPKVLLGKTAANAPRTVGKAALRTAWLRFGFISSACTMAKNRVTRGFGLLEGFLASKRARMADDLIPENLRNGRILDIGCGVSPFFLTNTQFREKYGTDTTIEAPEPEADIILKKCDLRTDERLPFPEEFFDVVTMLAVTEHIEPVRLVDVFREARRLLKPNGRFIITTPCPWTDGLLRFMAALRLVSPEEIRDHKVTYHLRSLALYLEQAGFEREKVNMGYFEMRLNSWAYVDK